MSSPRGPLPDVMAEAQRIVSKAGHQTLVVRVLGGVGVALHDHGTLPASLQRTYADIDIVVPAKSTRATTLALMSRVVPSSN